MQTAQYAEPGPGVVVLDELDIVANRFVESFTTVTLLEKTTVIAEYLGFYDFDFGDWGVDYFHFIPL